MRRGTGGDGVRALRLIDVTIEDPIRAAVCWEPPATGSIVKSSVWWRFQWLGAALWTSARREESMVGGTGEKGEKGGRARAVHELPSRQTSHSREARSAR